MTKRFLTLFLKMTFRFGWVLWFLSLAGQSWAQENSLRQQTIEAMKKSAEFYRDRVASHGGYVYHYSVDLSQRWGEGEATKDQIWIQPPGTPTVGLAFLKAYEATGDDFYLAAATDAALAVAYGQLHSGGWTNSVDFNPESPFTAAYRNGKGKGKDNSSLDDGQTQSALLLVMEVDRALGFKNGTIHETAMIGLDALLNAQFPNGGFPQVWKGPVAPQPMATANYPSYQWRTEGRIKNYWDMYTLNDNVTGYVAETLIAASSIYDDKRTVSAIEKLGDFLIAAQMPEPQPGWAQQYNYKMQPIWARKFEPPGVSGDETQEVLETLLKIYSFTGERKYLDPFPAAFGWLKRSRLADGQIARYYELKTNRPLYMSRRGQVYTLTYDDSNLPSHYGWKTEARIESIEKRFQQLVQSRTVPIVEMVCTNRQTIQNIIEDLDSEGRWLSTFDGARLVGQAKMPIGTKYLSSQVFSDHLTALSQFLLIVKWSVNSKRIETGN